MLLHYKVCFFISINLHICPRLIIHKTWWRCKWKLIHSQKIWRIFNLIPYLTLYAYESRWFWIKTTYEQSVLSLVKHPATFNLRNCVSRKQHFPKRLANMFQKYTAVYPVSNFVVMFIYCKLSCMPPLHTRDGLSYCLFYGWQYEFVGIYRSLVAHSICDFIQQQIVQ